MKLSQAEKVASRKNAGMEELYVAGSLYATLIPQSEPEKRSAYLRSALAILKKAIVAPVDIAISYGYRDLPAKVTYAIALCQEELGQYNKAISTFSQAIQLYPNDPDLYSGRGLAYYNQQDPLYRQDLLKAIELNSQSALPWLILAQDAFRGGKIMEAHRFALGATERQGCHEVKAQAYELFAIILARTGQKQDWVLYNFEQAELHAPGNPRIRHNLNIAVRQSLSGEVSGSESSLTFMFPDSNESRLSGMFRLDIEFGPRMPPSISNVVQKITLPN